MCDYNDYVRVVKFQNLMMDFELSFKSNRVYQQILEHTNVSKATEILEYIKKEYDTLFKTHKEYLVELSRKNDLYGKPMFALIKDFGVCNPNNLRYIYHSLLILDNISKNKLNNINFVEIGGGYGGLCFFIHNMAKLFNININSYTIFDLKEITILQKRYLKIFGIDINSYHINDEWKLNENSYLISNYAFSELPNNLQVEYTDKILNKYISYGFLVWNFIPIYDFIKDKKLNIEDERPYNNPKNKFVYIVPSYGKTA